MNPLENIRNFCIIAHIDHGKSTLADRILEYTGVLSAREARDQYLDKMDIERERGITIKAQTVRIPYTDKDGAQYILNLIDTPGHVDFGYEVSRSLAACDGALLVVDATQGVEAQTLANVYMALDHNHEIVPILNKIDLPSADADRVKQEIEETIGLDCSDAVAISAKTGLNIDKVLDAIIARLPAPQGDAQKPLKALIFDSWYDSYQGVVVLFRILDGSIKLGDIIHLMEGDHDYEVVRLGVFSPNSIDVKKLSAGEVGFLCANIKELGHARVGDTITLRDRPASEPVPSQWYSAVFTLLKPLIMKILKALLKSCSLTTRLFHLNQKHLLPLASASAADSLACCTWRLYRKDLNGNFRSNLLRRPPLSYIASKLRTAPCFPLTTLQNCRTFQK